MKLVLVQHGAAVAKEADPERPLSAEGRRDIDILANVLSQADAVPAIVLHSGKTRARQSAEVLSVGRPPRASDGLAPNDPPGAFADTLAGWREDVMVVGHQPFLGRLASLLLTGRDDAVAVGFHPGSALCLEREDAGVAWTLAWMLRPGILPRD